MDFKLPHVVQFAEENDFPPEAISALRSARVTGKVILEGSGS
jgi:hypothetical protein